MELIKKHEEFEKRMNANDDKINQMMHFAERLNDENHYASDKIMEKAHSIDKRWASQLFLFFNFLVLFFILLAFGLFKTANEPWQNDHSLMIKTSDKTLLNNIIRIKKLKNDQKI